MKIAIITTHASGGTVGGAERFYAALTGAFQAAGHDAQEVSVVCDEPDFETIKQNYLACWDLDLSRFDMVVSTKAPTWLVRHPRHVCYLVHTIRVFYDMFQPTFPDATPDLRAQQKLIHSLDSAALSPPRCRAVFSIGQEVSQRLRRWNDLEAQVLHPPPWGSTFHAGPSGDYLLLPGRLHAWKRVDLAIRAVQRMRSPLRLVITGTGEAEAALRQLATGDPRIVFRGQVGDPELVDLYAGAFAVPFVPLREDYGYVTLEAFASSKPVVTCDDSGEAAAIVAAADGGCVVASEPDALAQALDGLWENHAHAQALGRNGHDWAGALSWERIVQRLIAAAGA